MCCCLSSRYAHLSLPLCKNTVSCTPMSFMMVALLDVYQSNQLVIPGTGGSPVIRWVGYFRAQIMSRFRTSSPLTKLHTAVQIVANVVQMENTLFAMPMISNILMRRKSWTTKKKNRKKKQPPSEIPLFRKCLRTVVQ